MLIGLTGYAQHGKDTTANVLAKYGFQRYAFADTLKSMALALNPYICEGTEEVGNDSTWVPVRLAELVADVGWDVAKREPEVRRFLQKLGTEGVRDHLGQNAWVDALFKRIDAESPRDVVITDVRFPNEAAAVHAHGGQLWRVTRLAEDGTLFDNGLGTDHPSEAYVSGLPVDRTIVAKSVDGIELEVDRWAFQSGSSV